MILKGGLGVNNTLTVVIISGNSNAISTETSFNKNNKAIEKAVSLSSYKGTAKGAKREYRSSRTTTSTTTSSSNSILVLTDKDFTKINKILILYRISKKETRGYRETYIRDIYTSSGSSIIILFK